MINGHSPEITVLLMACSNELTPEKQVSLGRFLDKHSLNWERLYRLASRHRIAPFLFRVLQGLPNIPEKLLLNLQRDCRAIVADNLLKIYHYHQFEQILSDKGIEHISLKGIYLASKFYPDSGLRSIGDLDILIKKGDALPTIHLLELQGYQLNQKHTRYLQHDERSMLTDLFEISLFKPFFNNSHFDIDLHWGVVCLNKDYKVFDLNEIEAQPSLSIEWQVMLLVTHHGVSNIWQHIYYINDLHFLLKNKSINWDWLIQELRRYGLETIFLVGLYWCQQVWSLPLPAFIQELIETNRMILPLAGSYEKNWEADDSVTEDSLVVDRVTFFTKAQTQLARQIKIGITFFSSRVFRASTFKVGGRLLYIPKELGFITVFVRAVRSFSRFLPTHR